MAAIDWLIVLVLNGGVIAYGFYLARGTRTSREWFLGSRALPFWVVGLSMFATNIDNSDLVSVTGETFSKGFHILTVHTLGSAIGGLLAAFYIVPHMYRAGLYTNAEYLEARFGPTMRVMSAFIQIQYRTSVLGLMIWSLFLLLNELVGMSSGEAWTLIVGLVIFSAAYTAWGGLRTVVVTDALQAVIMMVGGLVIFVSVYQAVGGWTGMLEKLAALETETPPGGMRPEDLPHVGRFRGEGGNTSPYVVALGWIVISCGYWSVNHTQTMRLMGARSVWDMKMAAVVGVGFSMPIMLASVSLGLFGRALFPEITRPDAIYPHLAATYLGAGLTGLVVAGMLAAVISTFDSMGSALSAVFTRDVYARLLVRNRDDAHYVKVSRLCTVVVLALGFAYIPFIRSKATMLEAFRTLIPVFVTPLFGTYLVGTLTRWHRHSGLVALLCGSFYGLVALYDREYADLAWLPPWLTGTWEALGWSLLFTLLAAALTALCLGHDTGRLAAKESGDWLDRSSERLPPLKEHPFTTTPPWWLQPAVFAWTLIAISAWLVFGLFW